jgi:hypothetical protein
LTERRLCVVNHERIDTESFLEAAEAGPLRGTTKALIDLVGRPGSAGNGCGGALKAYRWKR